MLIRESGVRPAAAALSCSQWFGELISMRVLLQVFYCVFLGGFACAAAQAVEVYKDADGRDPARYSDAPFLGSETYEVPPLRVYTLPKMADFSAVGTKAEVARGYETLSISNIQNGEPVRANNGNITVKLAVTPELDVAAGHRFVVLLDGEDRKRSKTPTVEFINLDRGQHILEAMVVDAGGRELVRSNRVRFYVKRVSALLPPP
jgi:hypothetical protein